MKHLGSFELDEDVLVANDGLLTLRFSRARADAHSVSLDGSKAIAWLAPSGELTGLFVQDYTQGQNRRIPFVFGEIELVDDGEGGIAVWLVQHRGIATSGGRRRPPASRGHEA
jgi:hypothetical protein